MKIWKVSVDLIILALLTSCIQMHSPPMNMSQAAQDAKTYDEQKAQARDIMQKVLKNCGQKYKSIKKCL